MKRIEKELNLEINLVRNETKNKKKSNEKNPDHFGLIQLNIDDNGWAYYHQKGRNMTLNPV